MSKFEVKTETLHSRPVSYAEAGDAPVLLLVHGMGGNFENWSEVIEPLARTHTVIAPDLPEHGGSAPGGGDFSVGALAALGHERATLVGHSLGGGVAMQFSYQFPEMVERLVLGSSGGLGPEVSPVLRAGPIRGSPSFAWMRNCGRDLAKAHCDQWSLRHALGARRAARPSASESPWSGVNCLGRFRWSVAMRRSWPSHRRE